MEQNATHIEGDIVELEETNGVFSRTNLIHEDGSLSQNKNHFTVNSFPNWND
jgi:hypothetical protein